MQNNKSCTICINRPSEKEHYDSLNYFTDKLTPISPKGRYYRGEDSQLTEFIISKCPECGAIYDIRTYYYSDPESSMGMGRDEKEWYTCELVLPDKLKSVIAELISFRTNINSELKEM